MFLERQCFQDIEFNINRPRYKYCVLKENWQMRESKKYFFTRTKCFELDWKESQHLNLKKCKCLLDVSGSAIRLESAKKRLDKNFPITDYLQQDDTVKVTFCFLICLKTAISNFSLTHQLSRYVVKVKSHSGQAFCKSTCPPKGTWKSQTILQPFLVT